MVGMLQLKGTLFILMSDRRVLSHRPSGSYYIARA
jgi:hypothetical protein